SGPGPLSEADAKKFADLSTRYAECAQKAMGIAAGSGEASTPPAEAITNADRLIKATYDTLGPYAVQKITISYVRADGTIDPTYGEADVELGRPKPPDPADDPDRPIGAPVSQTPAPEY